MKCYYCGYTESHEQNCPRPILGEDFVRDLAEIARQRAQFDKRLGAETSAKRMAFIDYLECRILERLSVGKSQDCDEMLALRQIADN